MRGTCVVSRFSVSIRASSSSDALQLRFDLLACLRFGLAPKLGHSVTMNLRTAFRNYLAYQRVITSVPGSSSGHQHALPRLQHPPRQRGLRYPSGVAPVVSLQVEVLVLYVPT